MTLEELEAIEDDRIQGFTREDFIKKFSHMIIGEEDGAGKQWDAADKYKGKLIFSYDKDVVKLSAEIRKLNGWPEGFVPKDK